MRVAAVIMTHRPDCSRTIRSVASKVDVVICVGTHYEPHDWTKERAAAGDTPFETVTWTPLEEPVHEKMAPARNDCLDLAEKMGCDWAVLVDSDEWIEWNDLDLRGQLAQGEVDMLCMRAAIGHTRPRIFRLPRQGSFGEIIHEEFKCTGVSSLAPLAVSYETPKTPAEIDALCKRIVTVALAELEKDPKSPRYHYFLADCYVKQKKLAESVQHFILAGDYSEWDEFAAWCYIRATIVLVVMGKPGPAIKIGITGLSRHAGLGDLYWILACASIDLQRWEQAVFWAQNSIAHSKYCGIGEQYQRTVGCASQGLWEGPFEVMTKALEMIGNKEGSEAAKVQADQARQMRLMREAFPEEEEKSGPRAVDEEEPLPMGARPVELQLMTG